jgi:hypothetical protein
VFIIQVALQPPEFFTSLRDSLSGKTLLSWDNEEDALKSVVADLQCSFDDVQTLYSPAERKKGLADCIEKLFASKYVLNKTWRLSGWDNDPLTKGQLTYAALDVVCCHSLYVALKCGPASVYEAEGDYITFYACDISSKVKVKHGFSFTTDFLGHYNNGSVSRGFSSSSSLERLTLEGFTASLEQESRSEQIDVQAFVALLNEKKFCCYLCSSCWVYQRARMFFVNETMTSFNFVKSGSAAALKQTVRRVSQDCIEQSAFYCASMLASLFQMHPSAQQLQSLKKSINSDVYYGYIRETLAHLRDEAEK